MKVLFYFLTATVMTVCLSSCGPELLPIPGSDVCLVASDSPEYGKYQLYYPAEDQRISPAVDTAYVVWDKILGIAKDEEYLFSNEDGHFIRSADAYYFYETPDGKRFMIYLKHRKGEVLYIRSNMLFGWPYDVGPYYFNGLAEDPPVSNTMPGSRVIYLTEKTYKKYRKVISDLTDGGYL